MGALTAPTSVALRAGGGAVHSIKSGREQSQQGSPYSITSSASASSLSDMVKAERLGGLEVDDKLEPMIMSVVPGFPRSKSRVFQL